MQGQPTSAANEAIAIHRFAEVLARKFQDSAASFAAFRLQGLTIMVARGDTASELEEFIDGDLSGLVHRRPAAVAG